MSMKQRTILNFGKRAGALTAAALSLISCGHQEFVPTALKTGLQSPGFYTIPPKIDFLLVQDDTGSMDAMFTQIKNQMPGFINTLNNKGWDFHFATSPLTRSRNLGSETFKIAASRQDLNWKYQPEGWSPPFPGASEALADQVNATYFSRPDAYRNFVESYDTNNNLNGWEEGLKNIDLQLTSNLDNTGFLRNDAMLVVMVVGNGEDTSGVNYCPQYPGSTVMVPCNDGSFQASLNQYRDRMAGLKSNPALIRFVAAVAGTQTSHCLGGPSKIGTRYRSMADSFGGLKYDVCTQAISSVLADLQAQLTIQKQQFRTNRLFVPNAPNPDSIVVTKYLGGDKTRPVTISKDDQNGWTYEGGPRTAFAIDSPVPMNQLSGYIIRLNGTARLLGDDAADVEYKLEGARASN